MRISDNIKKLRENIPDDIKLVVVSKRQSNEAILEAYNSGERTFGENKVQELVEKQKALPKDIEWHMIGHLQTNKVKHIAPFVSLIHAVDSLKLLKEINKQAKKHSRVISCLLQFHIGQEESKYGFDSIDEAVSLLDIDEVEDFENIKITGVMGMATNTKNENQISTEFKSLKNKFEELKNKFYIETNSFKEISMGMSNDFEIAIEEGSTIIRVGSKIFR